ncbi:MAG: chitobiase/beta-hexosaminidase C-terminal domain-containing protein [Bacilli bacterium]|nr:chitobiase/beta-hexosaminidase C-terminal domain-containing protein [Bacilli bacterium]
MKRVLKISLILVIALALLFGITFLILYSGIFPILTGFNITEVNNTQDTTFNITFDKVRSSAYYVVEIHDSKDELLYKKRTEKNELTEDFAFIQENEKYKLDVYAYNKKEEVRKSNNTYEFTYNKEVRFTSDNSSLLGNETAYIYLTRNTTTKNYSIKVTKNKYNESNLEDSKLLKEDIVTNDIYEISDSLFKDESVELAVELLKNNNVIDTIKLYNNMNPIETPDIEYPENGSTISLDNVYLKFKNLTWADKYDIQITKSDGNVIASTSTNYNEVILEKNLFSEGVYTITVNAYLGDYSTKSTSMFKLEKKLEPVYLNKDHASLKKGDTLELVSNNQNGVIYFTVDGSDPLQGGRAYSNPIVIDSDLTLKTAIAYNGSTSNVSTYNIKLNKSNKRVYLASSNQVNNIGEEPFTNERKEMNLISDLIEKKLNENDFEVFRNDYLTSYSSYLNECKNKDIDLILSLESTSSINHNKTGLQTLVTNESANSFSLANKINNDLNNIKESKLLYTNNITGSYTRELDNIKSIMISLGYHDNKNDAEWIVNNRELIANTIANSIIEYYAK